MTQNLFVPGKTGRLAVRTKGLEGGGKPVVILVQGSNITGQGMYDFSYPGGEDYSFMDRLVAAGLGVITFSARGYGASDTVAEPFKVDTDATVEDFVSVLEWAERQGIEKPHLFGWSSGARVIGRFAVKHPERVGRMIFYSASYGGGNLLPPTTDEWFQSGGGHYGRVLSPRFTDPELVRHFEAYVDAHEPVCPNGIRHEGSIHIAPLDPTALTGPMLMVYGVEGGKAPYMQGGMPRSEFFEKLPTDDKALVILPGGDDFLHLQAGRHRMHQACIDFLLTR